MPRAAKPRKPYRRRAVNIPVMPELLQQFELQLRLSLKVLRDTPALQAFDGLAEIMDVIGLTLSRLKRAGFYRSFTIIQSGASAMLQIKGKHERTGKVQMSDWEFLPIVNAVNECIDVLPKLNVMDLYASMEELKALKLAERI